MGTPQNTTPTARPKLTMSTVSKAVFQSTLPSQPATEPAERPLKRTRTYSSPTQTARDWRQAHPHPQQPSAPPAPASVPALTGNTAGAEMLAGPTHASDEPPPQYALAPRLVTITRGEVYNFLADAVNARMTSTPSDDHTIFSGPINGDDIERLLAMCAPQTSQTTNSRELTHAYAPSHGNGIQTTAPPLPGIHQSMHATHPTARGGVQHAQMSGRTLDNYAHTGKVSEAGDGGAIARNRTGEAQERMDVDPMIDYCGEPGSAATGPQTLGAPRPSPAEVWPPLADFKSSAQRIRSLNKSGGLQFVVKKLARYPERHRHGPFDISGRMSEAALRAWNNEPANQRLLVSFFKGKIYMSEEDVEFYRSILRSIFTEATGEKAFRIISPKLTKNGEKWDIARAFTVLNLSPHATRILFEEGGLSSPIGSLFIDKELEYIPFFLYALDGFFNVLGHEDELAIEIETYLRDEQAREITRGLVMQDANCPHNVDQRVVEILSRVTVTIVDYGARDKSQVKRTIAANIHCPPPTRDFVLWEKWRDALSWIGAPTSKYGTGKLRKHMRCDACHGVDHPPHICPYNDLGWHKTPLPPKVRRAPLRGPPANVQAPPARAQHVQQGWYGPSSEQGGASSFVQPRYPASAPTAPQTHEMAHRGALSYDNSTAHVNAQATGNAQTFGDARGQGSMHALGGADAFGSAEAYSNANMYGNASAYGNANAYGSASAYGNANAYDNTTSYGSSGAFSNQGGRANATMNGGANAYGNTVTHAQRTEATYNSAPAYGNVPQYGAPPMHGGAYAQHVPPMYGGAQPHGGTLPFNNPHAYGRTDTPSQFASGVQPGHLTQAHGGLGRDPQGRPAHPSRHGQASRAQNSIAPSRPFMPRSMDGSGQGFSGN